MQSTSSANCFHCSLATRHVTAQKVGVLVEQNGQVTGDDSPASTRDQRRKCVRVNERVDRFPIFDAIERWNVHQEEVMNDK